MFLDFFRKSEVANEPFSASESKGKDGKKEEEEDEEETEDGEEEEAMNMRGTVSSKRWPNTTGSVRSWEIKHKTNTVRT